MFPSLHTIGAIIGTLSILLFSICTGFLCYHYVILRNMEPSSIDFDRQIEDLERIQICLIILCIILTISSCLLVIGIVKEKQTLMLPWMIFFVFGFALNFEVLQAFVAFVLFCLPLPVNQVEIIIDMIRIAISALIFGLIYHLYAEIGKDGFKKFEPMYAAQHEL